MEDLDVSGLFWLPDAEESKVPGRLTFDTTTGAKLSLIGSLSSGEGQPILPSASSDSGIPITTDPSRIVGVAGNQFYTLEDCMLTNWSSNLIDITEEEYSIAYLLSDVHFESDEKLEFSGVGLRIRNLAHWAGLSPISVDIRKGEQHQGQATSVDVHFKGPSATEEYTNSGTLTLANGYKSNITSFGTELTVGPDCSLWLERESMYSLSESLALCSSLQHLLTIGLDMPSPVLEISFLHPDVGHPSPSGKIRNIPIRLYARIPWCKPAHTPTVRHPAMMGFTLSEVGGLERVGNWLDVCRRFRTVVDSLMSHRYVDSLYVENRFFNTVTAAEALVRIRRGRRKIGLKDALMELAKDAGYEFEKLVGDIASWADTVNEVRVKYVVHPGLEKGIDSPWLYWLSESLYLLVALSLLGEADVEKRALRKLCAISRFGRMSKALASSAWP